MRMISEDFIMVIPTEINALVKIARIVTLNAMPLVNRIWLMKNRKWRPGAEWNTNGSPRHHCGGMKH